MHKAWRALLVLVVVSASAGCYHYTAALPGVLDTRSDGSTADASPPNVSDEELARTGVSAILEGDGVRADGAYVVVEERHFFAGITALLPGAFLLSNESATPELKAALGDGALREVRVSHQYSGFDVLLTAVANLIPCVPLFLLPQPYTFQATGERVAAAGTPPANRPVAPPVEPKPSPLPAPTADDAPPDASSDGSDASPRPLSEPQGEGDPSKGDAPAAPKPDAESAPDAPAQEVTP